MVELHGNLDKVIEIILKERKVSDSKLSHLLKVLDNDFCSAKKEFILVNCIADSLISMSSGLQFRLNNKPIVIPNMLQDVYSMDNIVKIAFYVYNYHGVKINFNKLVYDNEIQESMNFLLQIIINEKLKNGRSKE
jgi:hypothetical protein